MHVSLLTLFPDIYPGPLGVSLAGRALKEGLWSLDVFDWRAFGEGVHRSIDAPPYGGGAGMVLRVDVLARALDDILHKIDCRRTLDNRALRTPHGVIGGEGYHVPIIYLTPRGERLGQARVRQLSSSFDELIIICGRFEGVDERFFDLYSVLSLSLGDFVLSNGDIGALALIDAVVRLLPGVVGNEISLTHESFEGGLLEYAHYTVPRIFRDLDVPDVLLSGHHERINAWRHASSAEVTQRMRPDLWKDFQKKIVEE